MPSKICLSKEKRRRRKKKRKGEQYVQILLSVVLSLETVFASYPGVMTFPLAGRAVAQTDDSDIRVNPRIAARFTTVVSLKALAQATHKCLMVFIINISAAKVIVR